MRGKDFWLWLLLAMLWGSSFLAIGVAVESISPNWLVAGRQILGAACLLVFLTQSGRKLQIGVYGWLIATLVGVTGNTVPYLLISYAEQQVDTGLAALLMGVAPAITLCLAPLFHADETITKNKVFGCALGFSGVAILVGPSTALGIGTDILPQSALILAACFYALTALLSRRLIRTDPIQTSAASVTMSAVISAALCITTPINADSISPESIFALIYLGLGPTALSALIYFYLIPRIGAARIQQVNYMVPVIGVVLGMALLNERPSLGTYLAIPLICLSVYLVTRTAKTS